VSLLSRRCGSLDVWKLISNVLMVCIGLIWLRIGISGGLLWTRWWTFGWHKKIDGVCYIYINFYSEINRCRWRNKNQFVIIILKIIIALIRNLWMELCVVILLEWLALIFNSSRHPRHRDGFHRGRPKIGFTLCIPSPSPEYSLYCRKHETRPNNNNALRKNILSITFCSLPSCVCVSCGRGGWGCCLTTLSVAGLYQMRLFHRNDVA
jgi:hypothetical protein